MYGHFSNVINKYFSLDITFLVSIVNPWCIQNYAIMNNFIKRFIYYTLYKESGSPETSHLPYL